MTAYGSKVGLQMDYSHLVFLYKVDIQSFPYSTNTFSSLSLFHQTLLNLYTSEFCLWGFGGWGGVITACMFVCI